MAQRWQEMFNVYLQIQLHVLVPFGYTPDARG